MVRPGCSHQLALMPGGADSILTEALCVRVRSAAQVLQQCKFRAWRRRVTRAVEEEAHGASATSTSGKLLHQVPKAARLAVYSMALVLAWLRRTAHMALQCRDWNVRSFACSLIEHRDTHLL